MELSIVIPCLNEEKTISRCVQKALTYCVNNKIEAEIIIVDNASTDRTKDILQEYVKQYEAVQCITEERKGYGNAVLAGIRHAKGKYIIMADADDSYNFLELDLLVESLREGSQLVIGNRFTGNMETGAMPFWHKYVGNPVLSWIGRRLFHSKVVDFHCGMRGFEKQAIEKLNLQCEDMEFASEMIAKAETAGLNITQVPIKLYKDGREGKSHLRSIYHGYRHLQFMFRYARERNITKKRGFVGHLASYLVTFVVSAIALVSLLYMTSFIPKEAIRKNLLATTEYWQQEESLFYNLHPELEFTKVDNYADSILLNIMYHVDEKERIKSLLRTSYYREEGQDVVQSFKNSLQEEKEPNLPYERYWHGMMVILRPLFTLFTIVQIRIVMAIVLAVLLIGVLLELKKNKMWAEMVAMVTGLFLVAGFMIPFCIEYVSTWLVALPITWFVLRCGKKNPEHVAKLFIVSGVCTAFFDFLTTETIAMLLPLIVWLGLQEKTSKNKGCKHTLIETIRYAMLWFVSYAGMWAMKWGLSAIVVGKNVLSNVNDNIQLRLNGNIVGLQFEQYLEAPFRNLADLLPFINTNTYLQVITPLLITMFVIFSIFYFWHKPWKELYVSGILFIIGIIPLVRFMILNNHSYLHHFFTYRALIVTIMAWSMALYYGCQHKRTNR